MKSQNDKKDTLLFKYIGTVCKVILILACSVFLLSALFIIIFGHSVETDFQHEIRIAKLPEKYRAIYDMYQTKNYRTIRVNGVYDRDNAIEIVFRYNADFCNNDALSEMSSCREDLLNYLLSADTNYDERQVYILTYEELINDSHIRYCELSNHMDRNKSANLRQTYIDRNEFSKLKDYEWSPKQWWIYFMHFDNWSALEENFSYVEGVCGCELDSFSGIEDANPDLWENVKFLEIEYYGDDADVYEQELKELFPDAEVYIGEN